MHYTSESVETLVEQFTKLPTIGRKTAQRLAAGLRSATEQREDDISRAASQVFELLSEGERPGFHSELERNEFDRHHDHLLSICRMVLGR